MASFFMTIHSWAGEQLLPPPHLLLVSAASSNKEPVAGARSCENVRSAGTIKLKPVAGYNISARSQAFHGISKVFEWFSFFWTGSSGVCIRPPREVPFMC